MVSAYVIRRLVEAWKVSDQLRSRSFQVKRYRLIGRVPDFWNRDFWDLYDMDSPVVVESVTYRSVQSDHPQLDVELVRKGD